MIEKRNNNGQIQKLYDDKYMLSLCKEYDQKRNAKEIAERENIKLSTLYFVFLPLLFSSAKTSISIPI